MLQTPAGTRRISQGRTPSAGPSCRTLKWSMEGAQLRCATLHRLPCVLMFLLPRNLGVEMCVIIEIHSETCYNLLEET
jgi:hypothetical protein